MNLDPKISLSKYSVTPKLLRSGITETVTVKPLGNGLKFDDTKEYTVTFVPMEIYDDTYIERPVEFDSVRVRSVDGVITVSYAFEGEQEWVISVITDEDRENKKKPKEFHVYSLLDDLYTKNPYKGDLHSHSTSSDGTEDPVVVAANYRKEGFDFFALTDHHKWEPSDYLIKAYSDVPTGLKMFHGEEVHLKGDIHIVNFGSEYSINSLYRNSSEQIHKALLEESKTLKTPKGVNALEYCYRKWIHEEISKAGGLTIVPHPYWIHAPGIYNMNTKMLEYVFRNGAFHAFELIGGQTVHENNVQTSHWQELRAEGLNIPIVGSSDSHGTDKANYFGIGKTVVFSEDLELKSVKNAILDGFSVAIEQAYGEEYRVYGSYRLVKYTRFLLTEYFPGHDELCIEEGRLMREYALGDADAGEALRILDGRTDKYRERVLRGK